MKTQIILFLALLCSSISYAQKHTFSSYGLINNYTRGTVLYTPAGLSVENKGFGNYQIIADDPRDGSVTLNTSVKYKLYNAENEYYVYEGKIQFGRTDYNSVIRTKIKMSEFSQGNGNGDNFAFNKKYEIRIFYSKYGKVADDMDKTISLFPVEIEK